MAGRDNSDLTNYDVWKKLQYWDDEPERPFRLEYRSTDLSVEIDKKLYDVNGPLKMLASKMVRDHLDTHFRHDPHIIWKEAVVSYIANVIEVCDERNLDDAFFELAGDRLICRQMRVERNKYNDIFQNFFNTNKQKAAHYDAVRMRVKIGRVTYQEKVYSDRIEHTKWRYISKLPIDNSFFNDIIKRQE